MIEIIFFLILGIYVFFIVQLVFGFDKIKTFKSKDETATTTFSILVPFRNEAKNLHKLLQSISNLNYPKELFELILVDDFSSDNSERIYIDWRVKNGLIETTLLQNLRLTNSPKKDAISRAVPIVKHEWIITTDGDCEVNNNWLLTLDSFIQNNATEMVVSPVIYKTKNNWFHHFQQLDMLSLQATTVGSFGIGKPFMCNGANFAYTKRLFNAFGGFIGNNKMASGDDVFLLQKAIKEQPNKVHYLKNISSIVTTKPKNNLYKLFMQRVRWASKSSRYSNFYSKALALSVLIMNASLVCGVYLTVSYELNWEVLLSVFLIKYVVDYILLFKSNKYLRNGKFFLPFASSLTYPLFVTIVGFYSLFGSYTWKGRKFKK